MSVKTIRFNRREEGMLKLVLSHYSTDFSTCMKELIAEKLEDLQDMKFVKKLKEGKSSDYLSAEQVSKLYDKK